MSDWIEKPVMRKWSWGKKFCLAATVLWLLVIWGNSMRTAAESSEQSGIVLALLQPLLSETGLPEETWHTLIRKLAHMAEFALLGILWTGALVPGENATARAPWISRGCVLLLCLAAAAVDETIQLFVPGRSGQIQDVCIDLLGAALGILAVVVLRAVYHTLKENN